jgi:hypothetical protein
MYAGGIHVAPIDTNLYGKWEATGIYPLTTPSMEAVPLTLTDLRSRPPITQNVIPIQRVRRLSIVGEENITGHRRTVSGSMLARAPSANLTDEFLGVYYLCRDVPGVDIEWVASLENGPGSKPGDTAFFVRSNARHRPALQKAGYRSMVKWYHWKDSGRCPHSDFKRLVEYSLASLNLDHFVLDGAESEPQDIVPVFGKVANTGAAMVQTAGAGSIAYVVVRNLRYFAQRGTHKTAHV